MMPPCARLVLLSLGSAARVTSVTGIPASARQRATVPPATPQPRISTSVSMHSFMLLPSWNARVTMTQACPLGLRSLKTCRSEAALGMDGRFDGALLDLLLYLVQML